VDYTYLHHQIGLTLLHRVGPIKARQLAEVLGGVKSVFSMTINELHQATGLAKSFLRAMNRTKALRDAETTLNFMLENNIRILFYTDKAYPRRLRNCIDAPLVLYQKGGLDLNDLQWVSIVGTRAASSYGKAIVKDLIRSFQGKNIVVVSGLALGIDGYAHDYCIEYGIPTVAVLGHSFDRIYPYQHKSLARSIIKDGALISEFIPGTRPDRENFPKRNRIVAGMCDATIVVESKPRGGSLITADLANGYNRDVFAYPGSIYAETSQGCNELIKKDQAHLILSARDFLQFMDWETGKDAPKQIQSKLFVELTEEQETIVNVLREKPIHIDIISAKLAFTISKLNANLLTLEMDGIIQQLPGKMYSIC
jgi:DNA processing protein